MLQKILERPLEKKAGRNFGPPGNKTLIYFIDDMNMPEVCSVILYMSKLFWNTSQDLKMVTYKIFQ